MSIRGKILVLSLEQWHRRINTCEPQDQLKCDFKEANRSKTTEGDCTGKVRKNVCNCLSLSQQCSRTTVIKASETPSAFNDRQIFHTW